MDGNFLSVTVYDQTTKKSRTLSVSSGCRRREPTTPHLRPSSATEPRAWHNRVHLAHVAHVARAARVADLVHTMVPCISGEIVRGLGLVAPEASLCLRRSGDGAMRGRVAARGCFHA